MKQGGHTHTIFTWKTQILEQVMFLVFLLQIYLQPPTTLNLTLYGIKQPREVLWGIIWPKKVFSIFFLIGVYFRSWNLSAWQVISTRPQQHICTHVCMCLCMHVYMFVYECVHVYADMWGHVHVCGSIYVCLYVFKHTSMCECLCTYVYLYTCTCACIYVRMYMLVYVSVHECVSMYLYGFSSSNSWPMHLN